MNSSFKLATNLLVAAALLFGSINNMNVYAAENKLTIDVGENFSSTSTQVKLPVYIDNLPKSGLSSMNFVVEFEEGLVLSDVKAGEIISNSSDFYYFVKFNKVYIMFSDSSGGTYPLKEAGTLCYLTFSINAESTKESFKVRRISSDNETFADNYLNKLQADFFEGKILKSDRLYKVQSNKIWRITFNHEINPDSLTEEALQIKDINGQPVYTDYSISSDGKTLEILPPWEGYAVNSSYIITLKNSISSKYGRSLSKEQNINFYIDR